MKRKICICILNVKTSELAYNFYKTLKNERYDVIIVSDEENYDMPNYDGILPIIKIPTSFSCDAGFKSSVRIPPWKDTAYSRDKALYYFSRINTTYDSVWFIEEDVFIPSISTISKIDEKTENIDLVCAKLINSTTDRNWPHWNHALNQTKLPPPYFRSMVCAIKCSKHLLSVVSEYAVKYKSLFMDEVMFTTLAVQHNLKINNPQELYNVCWKKNWSHVHCNGLFHPIKSIKLQHQLREMLRTEPKVFVDALYHNRPD